MRQIVSIALIIASALVAQGCQKAEENPVIARVNNAEIRKSQLQQAIQRRAVFLQQQGQPIPQDLQQQAVHLLIQNELLYQDGSQLDIPDLMQAVEQQYRDLVARYPSEDVFKSSLQQANTTPEQVRQNIRKTVIINNLVENKIGKGITVSNKELKSFYKKNKEALKKPDTANARHILIALPPSPTEEEEKAAQEKIAEIKARLKKGEPFEELAMIYSDGPSSSQGGDLGTLTRGVLDPELEEIIFSAKKGRVVGPERTKSGYHLIRVDSREHSRIPSFKEVKEEIREKLRRDKVNQATAAYLGDVASRSRIEIVPQQPPM